MTIEGRGPYRFALDTGASSSVVDADIAEELRLRVVTRDQPVTGIAARSTADVVAVRTWGVPGVELSQARIASVDLPNPPGPRASRACWARMYSPTSA